MSSRYETAMDIVRSALTASGLDLWRINVPPVMDGASYVFDVRVRVPPRLIDSGAHAGLTLTGPEIDSLLGMWDFVSQHADYWNGKERGDSTREALDAFRKLLLAHGVNPEAAPSSAEAKQS